MGSGWLAKLLEDVATVGKVSDAADFIEKHGYGVSVLG